MSILDELLAQVRSIKMTDDQKLEQRLDFAYGNLAASTRHKPVRAAFREVAVDIGMSEAAFDAWADKREWSAVAVKQSCEECGTPDADSYIWGDEIHWLCRACVPAAREKWEREKEETYP